MVGAPGVIDAGVCAWAVALCSAKRLPFLNSASARRVASTRAPAREQLPEAVIQMLGQLVDDLGLASGGETQ